MNPANFLFGHWPSNRTHPFSVIVHPRFTPARKPAVFLLLLLPHKARAAGPLFAHRNGALRQPVEEGGEDEAVRQGIGT